MRKSKYLIVFFCFFLRFYKTKSVFNFRRRTTTHCISEIAIEELSPQTYIISGCDLETLKEWSKTLEYSMCEAPEELVYGNQVYVFKDKHQNVLFTYNSYKEDNWYLMIGENWYSVSNPSRPLPDVI